MGGWIFLEVPLFLLFDIILELAGFEGVLHQSRNCHRAYAAGYGCDERALVLDVLKINIAAELSVFISVHTDVDHYRAFLDHVGLDELRDSHRSNEDIGASADLGEVFCTAVADGDGAVLVEQKHSHWLADDIASADDYALLSLYGNVIGMEHFHYARRCTGQEIVLAEHDFADIDRMEGVDVLFGIDRLDNRLVVEMLRQRKLYENAVDILFGVKRLYKAEQLLLGRSGRQSVLLGLEADNLACLFLVINIHSGGGIVADDYNRQARGNIVIIFQLQSLLSDSLLYLCRYLFAVYNLHRMVPPCVC